MPQPNNYNDENLPFMLIFIEFFVLCAILKKISKLVHVIIMNESCHYEVLITHSHYSLRKEKDMTQLLRLWGGGGG